jgi:hypothetical protein
VQLHDVPVGEDVLAVDLLAVELRVPPDPGELEPFGQLLVDVVREIMDRRTLGEDEGRSMSGLCPGLP